MARFEDTPGLFGFGMCVGTQGDVHCDWCGTTYENREDDEGEPIGDPESIGVVDFGDKQICDCCFEAVEDAVLAYMRNILPWVTRLLKARRRVLEEREDQALAAIAAGEDRFVLDRRELDKAD